MKRYVAAMSAIVAALSLHVSASSPAKSGEDAGPVSRLDRLLGLRTVPGAFIADIATGSPAQRAGFGVCDLIAGFNGRPLLQFGELQSFVGALREAAASTGLDLEVWKRSDPHEAYRRDRVRIRVPLPSETRIGVDLTLQIMVLDVVEGGPSAIAGIGVGEFIDQVNDQQVANVRSLADLDQKIGEWLNRDGSVTVTLARWRPVTDSAVFKTAFDTREVVVKVPAAATDPVR
jgi:S1-C subfamily serine protease